MSPAGARLSTEQPRVAGLNGSGGRGCHAAPVLGPTRGHLYNSLGVCAPCTVTRRSIPLDQIFDSLFSLNLRIRKCFWGGNRMDDDD